MTCRTFAEIARNSCRRSRVETTLLFKSRSNFSRSRSCSKLLLQCLGGLVIERVVHGDGNLPSHQLEEFHPRLTVRPHALAAESDSSQAAMRGGQRQNTKGS